MKKRTIAIVSIALVLAILAVSIIATFPSYLFEEAPSAPTTNSDVQNDNIKPSQGEDVGDVGGDDKGIQSVLPDVGFDNEDIPQIPSDTLETLASDDGVKLVSANNAFNKDTKFGINKLGIFNKKYYRARHYVQEFAKNYTMYEITAKLDGKEVQPTDTARVVVDIPKKYDIDKVEVYYMLDSGVQKLDTVIDKDSRTVTVSFMQSGVYILIERDNATNDNTSSNDTSSNTTSIESEEPSSTPSDTSSDASSDESSSDITGSNEENNSSESTESDTSSDSSSTETDPNQDTMEGWTPWQ